MRRLVLSSFCVVALLGCQSASAARDGHVTGSVRLCGGPAPARCYALEGTISVLGRHDRLVASQRTAHSRFSFTLPAGGYTFLARAGDVHGQRQVHIEAGQTLRVNVVISVP